MNLQLTNKTAVITGGASGIGRAIAKKFAASGARVCILDLDATAGEALVNEIRAEGGQAEAETCDIGDQAQVDSVFQRISQRGKVQILVNSAGVVHIGTLESTTAQDFERVLRVNVTGMYNCLRACIGHMKANNNGVILNMASVSAMAGLSERFAYSTSKGAVIAMT
ncbi:MAG TPA: SDR family NAD(P)-dependent oxidoreductase, partial [Terriglobales bacterium]|nr:SDR family NAD(P)-dependent oxidoreductase [Terriglobales bacterium]